MASHISIPIRKAATIPSELQHAICKQLYDYKDTRTLRQLSEVSQSWHTVALEYRWRDLHIKSRRDLERVMKIHKRHEAKVRSMTLDINSSTAYGFIGTNQTTEDIVRIIVHGWSNLRELTVIYDGNVIWSHICYAAAMYLPRLTSAKLCWEDIDSDVLVAWFLTNAPKVRHLQISSPRRQNMRQILGRPKLDIVSDLLKKHPDHFVDLCLSGSIIVPPLLICLGNGRSLTILRLEILKITHWIKVFEHSFYPLFPHLLSFQIDRFIIERSETQPQDITINGRNFPKLTHLLIGEAVFVPDWELRHISLTHYTGRLLDDEYEQSMKNMGLTTPWKAGFDPGYAVLLAPVFDQPWTKLESLELEIMTDIDAKRIVKGCPLLSKLKVNNRDVDIFPLTIQGFRTIVYGLSKLVTLIIAGEARLYDVPPLDDLMIQSCVTLNPKTLRFKVVPWSCSRLQHLDIQYCEISKYALKDLLTWLPELRVLRINVFLNGSKEFIKSIHRHRNLHSIRVYDRNYGSMRRPNDPCDYESFTMLIGRLPRLKRFGSPGIPIPAYKLRKKDFPHIDFNYK
ncbi:hypothetical protein H4219_001289 [Mycoemilia scoparia]|uniref:F-box domain-containing protein n=1 Tax=Mycoemilia scoparia TaxID=417184 RepID=A0A9W8A0J3_9FUNG|nr:hypothetical protein H4219_001289 [Mycoemilia scoparia]